MAKHYPALITNDGFIDPTTLNGPEIHPVYEAPMLTGHMIVQLRNDYEGGLTREREQTGTLAVIGKSGHSRVMLHVERRANQPLEIDDARRAIVPIDIISLRAVELARHDTHDQILTVLRDMVFAKLRNVNIGRLALVAPNDMLDREEILEQIAKNRLLLPGKSPESLVLEDGTIEIPLADLQFLFCEENFDEEAMRSVIRFGKHGMHGIQAPIRGKPELLRGHQSFVGAIHISIGPFIAIIEPKTSDPRILHLAARVLDGIRTTGIDVNRQIELFNIDLSDVSLDDVRVRIKLYHDLRDTQQFAGRIITPKTLRDGVSFRDVIQLEQHPERLINIMHGITPAYSNDKVFGYLIGPGKSREMAWLKHPNFQYANAVMVNTKVAASDPKYCALGDNVPHHLRGMSENLRYVGAEQNESRVCATWGFLPTSTIQSMLNEGTAVFIAHDVRMHDNDAFPHKTSGGLMTRNGKPANDVYFDDTRFADFQRLSRQGARFFMIRRQVKDAFTDEILPTEVLEWHERGMWVKPDQRERLEKVDTVIAMYGSHKKEMNKFVQELRPQIEHFALRMKRRFGSTIAFIHGKGPGLMLITDEIARQLPDIAKKHPEFADITEDIFSIGIGISVERIGQDPNFQSHAQLDFQTKDRLVRQKHMNDRSTFNIFNIGGAGTLEEVALSICSQKLFKNIPTPMIFVDPAGMGKDNTHIWHELSELITTLASEKRITSDEASNGFNLLDRYIPKFIHVVSSYNEAADIIESFADDPTDYYIKAGMPKANVELAFEQSLETYHETKFPVPDFLRWDTIVSDPRWDEVNT